MENQAPAIQVNNVNKSYGPINALCDLDLSVRPAEIFGLVGANGAGKTTLIKILVGLLPPDSGTVRVLGLDPRDQRRQLRAQVGYMPQSAALYEDLTARENVRFFARGHGASSQEAVTAALARVDLLDRQRDLVYGFSGGMKQRLSLACALVHRPRLLLLDEPSTGVDPRLRDQLWHHFRALTQEGVTILVSTHQMDEVLHCDRVAIMRAGRQLACDSPRGLLSRGSATVTIWQNGTARQERLHDYSRHLPSLLGLNTGIDRIEVAEPTLEEIVLELIREHEPSPAEEPGFLSC